MFTDICSPLECMAAQGRLHAPVFLAASVVIGSGLWSVSRSLMQQLLKTILKRLLLCLCPFLHLSCLLPVAWDTAIKATTLDHRERVTQGWYDREMKGACVPKLCGAERPGLFIQDFHVREINIYLVLVKLRHLGGHGPLVPSRRCRCPSALPTPCPMVNL